MCSIIGEFKLCTCSKKIDKSKPYWVIERLLVDENEIYPVCIGMHAGEYLNNIDSILDKLNNGNPFDFEYNSLNNPHYMKVDEISNLLKENKLI